MKQLFLGLLTFSCIVSCKTSSRSPKALAPTPVPENPTGMNVEPMDELNGDIYFSCSQHGADYYTVGLTFFKASYVVHVRRYPDEKCAKANAEVMQSGIFEESEAADKASSELTLNPSSEMAIFAEQSPESLKSCMSPAAFFTRPFQIALSKNCGLPSQSVKGGRMRYAGKYGLSRGFLNLGFLKSYYPDFDVAIKWDGRHASSVESRNRLPSAAEQICDKLSDHKFSNGDCVAIEYTKADPQSLIEFEKGTGLYPRLVDYKRDLGKIPNTVTVKIPYQFPCHFTDGNGAEVDIAKNHDSLRFFLLDDEKITVDLLPQGSEQEVEALFKGKGQLTLEQSLDVSLPSQLQKLRVDENCRLLVAKPVFL